MAYEVMISRAFLSNREKKQNCSACSFMEFENTFQVFLNSEEMNFVLHPPSFKQLLNNLFRFYILNSNEHFFIYYKRKPVRKIKFHHKTTNQLLIIQQLQNKGETYYSVCIDYKVFIIQEKYYDSFLTTLKKKFPISENPRVIDLSNKTKYSHPFFQNISINPHQYSHIHTEIANFSQSLQLQKIEIWPFIEEVLIGFIICKGYEYSNDYSKLFLKRQERLFHESDLIFLRSLKSTDHSNDISQTDLYYYFKDQSIYVIKIWNNNNQESLKKYEKERAVFEVLQKSQPYLDFPQYFGQAIFSQPKPNIVIEYLQGQNLYDILNRLNQREVLSKEKKLNIILSIMYSIETLHFNGLVYRDLKFDNVIVLPNPAIFYSARLVDFDVCCKLPSKKCEPIDQNPKYFFKVEIDYANNIITVLKIDRETNTRTFLKRISPNDNYNISPPENSKLEMSTETYDLMDNIKSNYFSSPEHRTSNKYTYASDIYSIGKFMYYLCIGEIPSEQTEKHIKFPPEYSFLERLYRQCTRKNPSERPNISIVINKFVKLILRLNNDQKMNSIGKWAKKNQYLYFIRFNNFYSFVDKCNTFTYDTYALNLVYPMVYFLHSPFFDAETNRPLLTRKLIEPFLSKLFFLSEYYHFEQNALNGRSLGILGRLLNEGIFSPKNEIMGRTYLLEGALRNDSFSQFHFANLFVDDTCHCNKHTLNIAMSFLEKSANTGSLGRINYLGLLYLENASSPGTIFHGIELLKRSADQYNNSDAQAILGNWYYEQQDIDQAIYYLERSSMDEAKFVLAKIYSMLDDTSKSIYYIQLAAKDGLSKAQFSLSQIYLLRKLTSEALRYLTLASKETSNASFLLFCLYTANIFPQKGFEKSLSFFQSSIEQENDLALQIYTQLTKNNPNHSPDLNEYIKSIPSGRKSLTYFVNLINSSKYRLGDTEYEDDFVNILYNWYLFTYDYDCDIREFADFEQLLISLGQSDRVVLFYLGAIYRSAEGDTKALTFLDDYSKLKGQQYSIRYLLKIFQPLADSNNGAAQWFLASKLLYCPEFRDIPKGIRYLKAAAKNNNERAIQTLCMYYFSGEMEKYGIPINVNLGLKKLKRAADKGILLARGELSFLLVPWDLHLAFSYAKEAISKGYLDAYFPLGLCYLHMMKSPGDLFCQKAMECLNIAARFSNWFCKAMLAMIYFDGILASKDEERSFRLYTELVNTEDREFIHNNLGVILKNGNQSVHRNIPLAIEYFETAIKKRNDIFALFNLSRMYFYGEGVPKNIDKATKLLRKLKRSQFKINIGMVSQYIQRHTMISAQIFDEALDNCDMNQILPESYRNLFPPKCFDFIDFVYSIDCMPFMKSSPEVLIQKPLKSEIVTAVFYEGLL